MKVSVEISTKFSC